MYDPDKYDRNHAKRAYIRRAVNLLMRDADGENADLIPPELQDALMVCRGKYGKVSMIHPLIVLSGDPKIGKTCVDKLMGGAAHAEN